VALAFQRSLVTRRVVSLDEVLQVGDRKVKCVKERQVLRAGDESYESTYWHSSEVPGFLVKSSCQHPSYDGKVLQRDSEVTGFSTGK
jgi:hypothetical protein